MSQALKVGQDDLGGQSKQEAAVRVVAAPPYEPDVDAYTPDPKNDKITEFQTAIAEGASLSISLACKDGRRELFELDRTEAGSWIRGTADERREFANFKICERHLSIALRAAKRLTERGLPPTPKNLTIEEEAYLREFDAIDEQRVALDAGGYRLDNVLRESFSAHVGKPTEQLLREDFFDGYYGDQASGYSYGAPGTREYLPRGGPAGQQLQIADVWDELAKCYYAWTHDPIARRGCEILADFPLGRGIRVIAADDKVQAVIDEFNEREKFQTTLHQKAVSLSRDGELFERLIRLGDGRIKVRSLPPATIWEIVTDAEDPLEVFWYVQRYQTRNVLFSDNLPAARMRWIERTIAAGDIIHVKINASESDVRGRSDLYPALGWLKRLRDYFDALVQKEYATAAYQWHYKVDGGAADLQRIATTSLPKTRPDPGSYFLSNKQIDIAAVNSGANARNGDGSTYESLINHIALSFGLDKVYFGCSSHTNRASALVATEPPAKKFEERQDVISAYARQLYQNVIAEAKRHGVLDGVQDFEFRVVFPTIIKADAETRQKMLATAESMGWISKARAANENASELELDNYDYDSEKAALAEELGADPSQMIARTYQMVKKGLPAPDDPAFDPSEVPNPAAPGAATSTASPTSAVGAKKARKDLAAQEVTLSEAIEKARDTGALVIMP